MNLKYPVYIMFKSDGCNHIFHNMNDVKAAKLPHETVVLYYDTASDFDPNTHWYYSNKYSNGFIKIYEKSFNGLVTKEMKTTVLLYGYRL